MYCYLKYWKMKKSLLIHYDSLDVLDDLTTEQIAELFLAIKKYKIGRASCRERV